MEPETAFCFRRAFPTRFFRVGRARLCRGLAGGEAKEPLGALPFRKASAQGSAQGSARCCAKAPAPRARAGGTGKRRSVGLRHDGPVGRRFRSESGAAKKARPRGSRLLRRRFLLTSEPCPKRMVSFGESRKKRRPEGAGEESDADKDEPEGTAGNAGISSSPDGPGLNAEGGMSAKPKARPCRGSYLCVWAHDTSGTLRMQSFPGIFP